jgi:hypothetical protein
MRLGHLQYELLQFYSWSRADPRALDHTDKFWLYATAIPTTAVVMLLGWAWLQIFARRAFAST